MVYDVCMVCAKQCILQFSNFCHTSIIFQVVVKKEYSSTKQLKIDLQKTIVLAVEAWLLCTSSNSQVNLSSRSFLTQ